MSIQATLQCLQCKQLITNTDGLRKGQCSCGALLISVDVKVNSSEANEKTTAPGFFDDAALDHVPLDDTAFSDDDEFLTAPNPMKQYDTPSFINYDSQYFQPSDSEEELLLTASQGTDKVTKEYKKQADQSSWVQEIAKFKQAKAKSTSTVYSPLSFYSSPLSATTSHYGHHSPPEFSQSNKETRGQHAQENQGKTPQELTQMMTDMWNNLTENQEQTFGYAYTSTTSNYEKNGASQKPLTKRMTFPSGNCYMLFSAEQFPLVQREYNIKGRKTVENVQSIVSKRWRELDPEIKKTYQERARKIKEDWKFEHPGAYQFHMKAIEAKRRRARKTRRKAQSY